MTTKVAVGAWFPRKSSSAIESDGRLNRNHALFLLGLGFVAAALNAGFHWPLKLPGHHGLEWMALLMFGRCASPYRWAATLSAAGAASFSGLHVFGLAGEPLAPLFYLAAGLVADGFHGLSGRGRHLAVLAAGAAIAHATKPLLHWAVQSGFGWSYGSLSHGLAYPLTTHLLFGLVGGLAGIGFWKATERLLRR